MSSKQTTKTSIIRSIIVSVLVYICVFAVFIAIILGVHFGLNALSAVFPYIFTPFKFASSEILVLLLLSLIVCFFVGLTLKEGWENKKWNKKTKEIIKRVATLPSKHNFNWQGGYSFIVLIVLGLITGLRLISCLQWCKCTYRKFVSKGKDSQSKRPNVSPIFQEVYYVIWAAVLILQVCIDLPFEEYLYGLNIYFIIESFTWILYYSVFRRFFEENYSIYHVLEHLPTIIFLIPLQAVAYALIQSDIGSYISWREIYPILMGQATENHILFSFVGFLYTAIVISMILSMFPPENVKRGNPETIILGAGEVVREKLLPAILRRERNISENKWGKITVYDKKKSGEKIEEIIKADDSDEELKKQTVKQLKKQFNEKNENQEIKSVYELIRAKRSVDDVIAWICTPSDTHWYYLEMLQNKVDFVAVEKPITCDKEDLACFKEFASDERRENTFFLSYYMMDKALPLTFLARPREFYLKYLWGIKADAIKEGKIEWDEKESEEESFEIIRNFYEAYLECLGSGIKEFKMSIIEGEDKRPLPAGGQLIETFIHNCLMASLFAGLPERWEDTWFYEYSKDSIHMTSVGAKGTKIDLSLKKNAKEEIQCQTAEIILGNGATIEADFKLKTATFKRPDNEPLIVGVRKQYSGKYGVQCDMVYDCYANKIKVSAVDGLYNQIEVLEWLLDKYEELETL